MIWRARDRAFERQFHAVREQIELPVQMTVLGPAPLSEVLEAHAIVTKELNACGLRELGDIAMRLPDGTLTGLIRTHVDVSRTIVAELLVPAVEIDRAYVFCESFTTSGSYVTEPGRSGGARPPSTRTQSVAVTASIAALVEAHRAWISGTPQIAWRTLDELMARKAETRRLLLAWRAAQSPEALLEADLRSLLGEAFEHDGARWSKHLRAALPRAVLVRKP